MIDKKSFYHGAALLSALEDSRCQSIVKHDAGYLANGDRLFYVKYTTKDRSPWGFSFTVAETLSLRAVSEEFTNIALALVCGGDGICAIPWAKVETLLEDGTGRIATKRQFNKWYSVTGPAGELDYKIPIQSLPSILFDD